MPTTERRVDASYCDPLEMVWIETARQLGIQVVRSADTYAAWDGKRLTLSTAEDLDADDSLAQMIFHELCHALVEGPEAFGLIDWGLENRDDSDRLAEQACLRLQAALATSRGLRLFFAPTTEHRIYYDSLPEDPLTPATRPAAQLARRGWQRATEGPWRDPLQRALSVTAVIARAVHPYARGDSLWLRCGRNSE